MARPGATATITVEGERATQSDAAEELAAGTVVGGYSVERLLGRGAHGAVYLAHDAQLERHVALKLIALERLDSADGVERLLREARTLARLSHPNIVTIHGLGEHEGRPYLALEHVAGASLAERLAEGPLSLSEARRLAGQIGRALAHAHAEQIAHGDLSPANVLLGAEGRAKVTDFGLAEVRMLGEAGGAHSGIRGTPRYMAPELWRAEGASAAADVWALGVLLYEMVSGRWPWDAPDEVHQLGEVVASEPPQLDRAPRSLRPLLRRCLAPEPSARPAMSALVEGLGHTEGAPPRRWWAAAAMVLALAAAAGWWRSLSPAEQTSASLQQGPSELQESDETSDEKPGEQQASGELQTSEQQEPGEQPTNGQQGSDDKKGSDASRSTTASAATIDGARPNPTSTTTPSTAARALASPLSSSAAPPFNHSAVQKIFNDARPRFATACANSPGASHVSYTMTYAEHGKPNRIVAPAGAPVDPRGACVRARLAVLRIPPFSGPSPKLTFSVDFAP